MVNNKNNKNKNNPSISLVFGLWTQGKNILLFGVSRTRASIFQLPGQPSIIEPPPCLKTLRGRNSYNNPGKICVSVRSLQGVKLETVKLIF